jgi:hypothetical protein
LQASILEDHRLIANLAVIEAAIALEALETVGLEDEKIEVLVINLDSMAEAVPEALEIEEAEEVVLAIEVDEGEALETEEAEQVDSVDEAATEALVTESQASEQIFSSESVT